MDFLKTDKINAHRAKGTDLAGAPFDDVVIKGAHDTTVALDWATALILARWILASEEMGK